MKRLGDESGQALIIAALGMTCLLGFVALAADVGIMFREKRLVQIAADSGAIAGAAELNYGDSVAAATADVTKNGFDTSNGATITVSSPLSGPAYGPYAGNNDYVEVIVSQRQPTIFMRLFHQSSMTVTARAVATSRAGTNCMYLLGSSGSNIALSGSGSINVPSCGIIGDSSSASAIALSGSGNISAKSLGVVAASPGYSKSGSGKINPDPPTAGIIPVSDPLAFLPQPSLSSPCTAYSASGSSSVTLVPRCYGGLSFSGSGAVTLNPGLYVINGPISFSGSGKITGSGVTLYVTSAAGSVNLSGSQPMNLSAPTSGTYNGILFFQQRGDVAQFSISGSGNMSLTGIFYMPNAALNLSGSSSATYDAAFVASQVNLSGSGTITLNDYAATNGSSPLSSVRLVE